VSRRFELEIALRSRGLAVRDAATRTGLASARARGAKDAAVLPASALRGALREALERLLRGAGQPACSGGDGRAPGSAGEPVGGPCGLDGGAPCQACRLFGGARRGLAPGQRRFAALVLGAARAPVAELRLRHDTSIALHRAQRTNAAGRRHGELLLELQGQLLAHGRLLDPELAPRLEAAVRATQHIGPGRSRGLGRVELRLHWLEREPAAAAELPPGDALALRVTLASPAAFGSAQVPAHAGARWRDTRREIPGSALRGAVGFALAEQLESADDPLLQRLVDPTQGARFGFLYPVRGLRAPGSAAPWTITARTCSAAGSEHGVVDGLLDRIRAACAQTPEEAERAWSARAAGCSICGSPLEPPAGTRGCAPPPRTRLVARVRLERAHGTADPASGFVEEVLDPEDGVAFEGTIRAIPPECRALLARALAGPFALGRGVALGQGHVQIEVSEPRALEPLSARAAAFAHALREHLRALELDPAAADEIVPITLLSPLIPAREGSDGSEELAAALGPQPSGAPQWLVSARRFAPEGGFDQRSGEPSSALAIAAGSVFAVRLRGGWREQRAALERLEREGAGNRRHQGYGELLCFDPLIWHRPSEESRR
jgi:CRISPR-associated protein Csx10